MTAENSAETQVSRGDKSSGRDGGQIALVVLVGLAIVASVVMLFTDSNTALKLALIAALWAAIIGFFLVYRYRTQARKSALEMDHQEQLHSVQLEKAQRETRISQELARREGGELNAELLTELKLEIAALRAQLEELSGQPLAYEPEAIRAEARRILAVEARTQAASLTVVEDTEPVKAGDTGEQKSVPSVVADQRTPSAPHEPGETHAPLKVVEESDPVTAGESDVDYTPNVSSGGPVFGAPSPDAVAGRVGNQDFRRQSSPNPLSALITENSRKVQEERAAGEPSARQRPAVKADPVDTEGDKDAAASAEAAESGGSEQPDAVESAAADAKKSDAKTSDAKKTANQAEDKAEETDDKAEETDVEKPTDADAPTKIDLPRVDDPEAVRGGGRRRRDERSGAVSVADLMKNLKKDDDE